MQLTAKQLLEQHNGDAIAASEAIHAGTGRLATGCRELRHHEIARIANATEQERLAACLIVPAEMEDSK